MSGHVVGTPRWVQEPLDGAGAGAGVGTEAGAGCGIFWIGGGGIALPKSCDVKIPFIAWAPWAVPVWGRATGPSFGSKARVRHLRHTRDSSVLGSEWVLPCA